MVTRQELHALLDEIPDDGLEDARRYLAALKEAKGDPFLARLLLAPEDDEPTTPEEDAGAQEAWQEYLRGETISPWAHRSSIASADPEPTNVITRAANPSNPAARRRNEFVSPMAILSDGPRRRRGEGRFWE